MIIVLQLIGIVVLLYMIYNMVYSMFWGAPYAPLGKKKIEKLLTLLEVKPGETAIDLGSGDGRIVIALAKKGAIAHGYELNPLLALWSKWKIKREKLDGKAYIHWGDFWKEDLSQFDIITIYLTTHAQKKLEKKLFTEVSPAARVGVNYFHFPTWKPIKQIDTLYLYKNTPRK